MLQSEAAIKRVRKFGGWLGLCAVVVALAIAGGCSRDRGEERSSSAGIEFGIWVPDAYGELQFVATDEVPNVVISPDGRTSTRIGVDEPFDGYVENLWYVSLGDPVGEYKMSVELADGRKATFRFRLGEASVGEGAI
jgi:hypothetical protein